MGLEKRNFLSGMDFDSEERFVKNGFTRKNVNIRVGNPENNATGVAFNVLGNTLIPNVDLPSGDNIVIGSYWFQQKDLNYYFVYNSDGNHGIFEYNHVSSKIQTVMISSELNFSADNLITGVNVVPFDVDNDLLYWVSNDNPPRKINIQKAKSGGYGVVTQQVLDLIKYPPLFPPICERKEDTAIVANSLGNSMYQFKARYGYDDHEYSAFSPISVQVLPNDGNYIEVKVPVGSNEVTHLEIAMRDSNTNDFVSVAKDKVAQFAMSSGYYIYKFYNDTVYDIIDVATSNKLYDSVPKIARAQEFIKGRLTLGNITEGYDNVDVNYDLEVGYENATTKKLNTIRGTFTILNPFVKDNKYDYHQPIYKDGNGVTVFGGFDNSGGIESANAFAQRLPLDGFVLYLAGTNHYAITKQVLGNDPGQQNSDTGVYNKNNNAVIRANIGGTSTSPSLDPYNENGSSRVWSYFEFTDVPDGAYLLRVASHLTTQDELNDGSYQKSSTNTVRVGGRQGFECRVVVSGGQILNLHRTEVMDLTSPGSIGVNSNQIVGYLCDSANTPSTIQELLDSPRIAGARVGFVSHSNLSGLNAAYDDVIKNVLGIWSYGSGSYSLTDHNGYFFCAGDKAILNTNNSIYLGGYSTDDVTHYDLSLNIVSTFNNDEVYAFRNLDYNIRSYTSDSFEFYVVDNKGKPAEGVSVVVEGGEIFYTDSSGLVNGVLWASNQFTPNAKKVLKTIGFYYKIDDNATFNPSFLIYDEYISKTNRNRTLDPLSYDNVVVTYVSVYPTAKLRRGGTYEFGLVYYDRANRSGLTNQDTPKSLYIPFYTQGGHEPTAPIVSWNIYSLPPSWATHYQWVRTKDTFSDYYLQWASNSVSILDTKIEIDISNLSTDFVDLYPSSILSYTYVAGDRIRIIGFANGQRLNTSNSYYDAEVLGFDSGTAKITIEKLNSFPDFSANGVWFEVYRPKLKADSKIFYEIGEVFEVGTLINNNTTYYFHKGGSQDQDPLNPNSTPAKGTFQGGDTFYRNRTIPIGSNNKTFPINSIYYDDTYESAYSDIGRPNTVDVDYGEVTKPVTVYYSEKFIPGTIVNGLSSFFDVNFEDYYIEYGGITKLFNYDGNLDCYQERRIGKILVEKNIIYDQFAQGTMGASKNVLSDIMYYAGDYGTINPESFSFNEGRRYVVDIMNGKVLRLGNDGITTISDNLMHDYFESKSNFYSSFNIIPKIWGVFDEMNNEYVISFGEVSRPEGFTPDDLALVSSQAETVTEVRDGLEYTFYITYSPNVDGVQTLFQVIRDISNGTYIIESYAGNVTLDRQKILSIPAETISFNENTKFWNCFYTFYPQCMGRVGIMFLSFYNGRAFLHNTNQSRNNFYGSFSASEIWVVFNENPSNVKVFNALSQESNGIWYADEIVTPNGQKTSLDISDFEEQDGGVTFDSRENIHYAHLWQDENTPNVSNPLFEGDDMRDVSILVKLKNDNEDKQTIFAANMNYSLSYRSNL